jgi:CheY-like chemotaxis protein
VDDDHVFLTLVQGLLQGTGHRLKFAADALQATSLAIRERPDLVLLDLQLPGGDGLTILKRLKSNSHTRNIPVVIYISASDPNIASSEASQLGAAAYLPKPITRAGLLATIEQVLNSRQG